MRAGYTEYWVTENVLLLGDVKHIDQSFGFGPMWDIEVVEMKVIFYPRPWMGQDITGALAPEFLDWYEQKLIAHLRERSEETA